MAPRRRSSNKRRKRSRRTDNSRVLRSAGLSPESLTDPSKNLLFVVGGSTGAGKTTIQNNVGFVERGLQEIPKDDTRERRGSDELARYSVSPQEYERRKQAGVYLITYTTRYANMQGEREEVHYGLPEVAAKRVLKSGDALLTLTDPNSFRRFFSKGLISKLEDVANVIPVLVTTGCATDLEWRLAERCEKGECSPEETERRIKQAPHQWRYFMSYTRGIEHLIINDSPADLLEIPAGDPLPPEVERQIVKAKENAMRKFASIINFYREIRKEPTQYDPRLNIHMNYVNKVLLAYFGMRQIDPAVGAMNASREGKDLTKSRYEMDRIHHKVRNPLIVNHVFGELKATSAQLTEDGELTIGFNDALRKGNVDLNTARHVFELILPAHGYWIDNDTTLRFSLTDRVGEDKPRDLYAVNMRIL